MRSIVVARCSVALLVFCVSLFSGIVVAETPPAFAVDVANAPRTDRGPAAVSPKTGPALSLIPVLPQAITSGQYPIEVEPNNTSATATPIGGSAATREGNIYVNGDIDFWSFNGQTGDRVYAATMTSLSSSVSVDSVLDLMGPDGSTVIETDLDDGSFRRDFIKHCRRHAACSRHLLPARTPPIGDRPVDTLPSVFPVARRFSDDGDRAQRHLPGPALPAGGWVSGATASTVDLDFYAVNLNAGDTVFISVDLDPERDTTEWNGQIGLGAFGVPPLVLVVNDAGTATPDSEAFFMTVDAAGTYGVFVGLPTGGTTFGTYHLNVSVFPKVDDGVNCTSYTSTNVPVTIAAGPSIQTSTLTVPGNPRIEDIEVSVNLTHNFMADLDVQLTAPGGNTVGLFSDIGSVTAGAQTTMSTTFDDEAAASSSFNVINGNRIAPELNYRLSWFDGQPAGGTWTMTLRDDASGDGGTLNSWSVRICEAPPPPACAPGFVTTTVLSTDFESGAAGFTHSGTLDEWELGNPTAVPVTGCNSGVNCWKTDLDSTYENSSNQVLLSPNINLAGLSPPVVVSWAQKFQMEPVRFDTFAVSLRPVGVPASGVRLFDHLGADMIDNVGNPIVAVQEAAGWGLVSARADALAGQNVEFAVQLTSDTTVQRAGLAIDDFSVTACRAPSADLAITKTDGVTTAVPGGSVTYTIAASNAGPDPVTGATVADTFPAVLSCSTTCVGAGGGTCTAGPVAGNINDTVDLPAGGSATYTSTCAINAAATGTLSNTATVSSSITDPTPANNSATDTDTLTPQADLGITKTDGVTSVAAGGSTTYTITASNVGPSNAPGSTVMDTFPASLTCSTTCVGAGGGTCTAGPTAGNLNDTVNLPSGGSVTYTAVCAISGAATGSIVNTATVTTSAGVTDPTPGNNSATDTDTVALSADLGITKTDGVTSVAAGGSTTYTITASNAGPSNAPGSTVMDTFPASLTCSTTCVGAGGGTCTAGPTAGNLNDTVNLPSGGSVTYTAVCAISGAATGSIVNTATVATSPGVTDPTPGNNSATDTNTVALTANLGITKTDGVASVTAGGATTYTIVASNAGPSATTGATVADTFPASLTCSTTCVGAGGGTCTAGPIAGNLNDTVNLPNGGSVTYTAACQISAAATGTVVNTATVTTPGGVIDPTPGNNSATDTDTVTGSADLGITKTDGVSTVNPNGSTTYTIVASNAGPSSVIGATVTDTFPAALTGCSTTCVATGGATCAAGPVAGNINDTINLPVGGSASYTAVCNVSPSASGTLANTATIAAPGGVTDPTPGNNTATDSNTVAPLGQLTITPAIVDFGSVAPGSTSATQTVTLGNAGGSPLEVTTLPAPSAPFNATGGTCGAVPITIANGSSCTLTYTFSPTAAGAASEVLTVSANAPGSGTISLQGVGGQGIVGVLTATLDFGPQLTTGTVQRTLTITNTGSGPLTVSDISAVAPPFSQIAGGTCGDTPFMIAAASSCTVVYLFSPTIPGTFTTVVTITSDVGTASATLVARGVAAIQLPAGNTLGSLLLLGVLGLTAGMVLRRRG